MMGKSVWVVESGAYSARNVEAVFDTEQAAKDYANFFESFDVTEFTLNPSAPEEFLDKVKAGISKYDVRFDTEGNFGGISSSPVTLANYERTGHVCSHSGGSVTVVLMARSVEEAVKIASEKRVQYLHEVSEKSRRSFAHGKKWSAYEAAFNSLAPAQRVKLVETVRVNCWSPGNETIDKIIEEIERIKASA